MLKNVTRFTIAAAALTLASLSAHAGLLGSTVTQCADSAYSGVVTANPAACDSGTAQATPASAVVSAGVEFSLTNSGSRTFDFGDDSLTIAYSDVGSSSPDLWVFDFAFDISSVSLVGPNALGVTFTFADDKLGVLVSSPLADGRVVLQIGTSSQVPEPGTLGLVGIASLSLLGLRRRRA